MNADFDSWNTLKKEIESNSMCPFFPKEGEVWVISLGRNIGYEQNGTGQNFSRPVLVIKKFNNQMYWCVPLSSKQKQIDFYYNYTDNIGQKVSVVLAQLKLSSIKRFKRKLYEIDSDIFDSITVRLKNFL